MPLMRYAAAYNKIRQDAADTKGIPSITLGIACMPHATGSHHTDKYDSAQPSQQMRRISVSKSPTTAHGGTRRLAPSPPPQKDVWPFVSSRAYQRIRSQKSPDGAGTYASGRTHSTSSSTPAEPTIRRRKAINRTIQLGRQTARAYSTPTSYRHRTYPITARLDAPHEEPRLLDPCETTSSNAN